MNDYVNEELENINKTAEDYSRKLREYGKLSSEHNEIGIKSRENIEMIRKHNMEVKEREQIRQEREAKEKRTIRTRKSIYIGVAILTASAISFAASIAAQKHKELKQGRETIKTTFVTEDTDPYGITYGLAGATSTNPRDAYFVNHYHTPTTDDSARNKIIEATENDSLDQIATYIAAKKFTGSEEEALKISGLDEPPTAEEIKAKEKEYFLKGQMDKNQEEQRILEEERITSEEKEEETGYGRG